jgi:hypothetical protein
MTWSYTSLVYIGTIIYDSSIICRRWWKPASNVLVRSNRMHNLSKMLLCWGRPTIRNCSGPTRSLRCLHPRNNPQCSFAPDCRAVPWLRMRWAMAAFCSRCGRVSFAPPPPTPVRSRAPLVVGDGFHTGRFDHHVPTRFLPRLPDPWPCRVHAALLLPLPHRSRGGLSRSWWPPAQEEAPCPGVEALRPRSCYGCGVPLQTVEEAAPRYVACSKHMFQVF